jgi:hypothetical protein
MEDDDRMLAEEAELQLEDDREPVDAEGEDVFELELDGQVHTLPGALKGAFLRQADYTRKTQELAEHRRAVEAEREALERHRRGLDDEASDRATLAALDRQIDDMAGIDWEALGQADPERARALWASFHQTQALRDEYAYVLSRHESQAELRKAREAAEAMAETGRTLSREIEGWSPEVAAKLVEYAAAFGVSLDELREAADPRLWKLLHKAWKADQANLDDAGAEALAVRPAVTIGGGGSGAAGVRDELSTKEWMRRRNQQATRGR